MSVSLYYTARRPQPITSEEAAACRQIAERYDSTYPFGELYEGFCIYDSTEAMNESEADVIFSGSTKLPTDGDQIFLFKILNWWLMCLGEITDLLHGAQWHVHLDDMDLPWEEDAHYLVPIDE